MTSTPTTTANISPRVNFRTLEESTPQEIWLRLFSGCCACCLEQEVPFGLLRLGGRGAEQSFRTYITSKSVFFFIGETFIDAHMDAHGRP